jgi:hypothetical protein
MGGFFGGGGGAAAGTEYTVLSDFDSNNLYTGLAPKGTTTSSAAWTIRKTTISVEGAVTAAGTKTNGIWNNRLTETYT